MKYFLLTDKRGNKGVIVAKSTEEARTIVLEANIQTRSMIEIEGVGVKGKKKGFFFIRDEKGKVSVEKASNLEELKSELKSKNFKWTAVFELTKDRFCVGGILI